MACENELDSSDEAQTSGPMSTGNNPSGAKRPEHANEDFYTILRTDFPQPVSFPLFVLISWI
jgi:hypothetical protein